jgi:MarR family transcriptional regulator, 2-MHQ and catechol-resistance regulon repressor
MKTKAGPPAAPGRFEALMSEAGRDVHKSRPIVALLRADGRVSRALEGALAPYGLTLPNFNVLMEIASTSDGRLPIHEICRRLLKSPPNVSALIDRMEREKLVLRARDQRDRRVVVVQITPRGWDRLKRGAPAVFREEKKLLKGFSRTELKALAGLLSALAEPAGRAS